MMTQKSLHPPIGRGIIYGAIGGLVGGIVMYAIMSAVMLALNMGANCFAIIVAMITGQPYSNSLIPLGIAVHLTTSTVIGVIFGVVISSIGKLRITGFARDVCRNFLTNNSDCHAVKDDGCDESNEFTDDASWQLRNDV
jgi:hypothetical protein